jgi:hypothetical protein
MSGFAGMTLSFFLLGHIPQAPHGFKVDAIALQVNYK